MNKKRKIWIAVVFSILAPGLGQIYCGHFIRGIVFFMLLTLVAFGKNFIMLMAMRHSSNPYLELSIIILLLIFVYVLALIDAILLARRYRVAFTEKKYNKWYIYLPVFLLVFLGIRPIGSHAFLVGAYRVPTDGMFPSIDKGDRVLVDNLIYNSKDVSRGDIIVFKYPENPKKKYTKRVIGLPGDTIEIRKKQVYINGNVLHESYVVHNDLQNNVITAYQCRDSLPPTSIPESRYFVMGDNRDYSVDSRLWGFLDRSLIEGEVKVIYAIGDGPTWKKIYKPIY